MEHEPEFCVDELDPSERDLVVLDEIEKTEYSLEEIHLTALLKRDRVKFLNVRRMEINRCPVNSIENELIYCIERYKINSQHYLEHDLEPFILFCNDLKQTIPLETNMFPKPVIQRFAKILLISTKMERLFYNCIELHFKLKDYQGPKKPPVEQKV